MRSSSTSRSGRVRTGLLAALAAAVVSMTPLQALDPERQLGQYVRDQWGPERGFPGGPVHGITQTSDGYLWIAAEKGLVRFDGLTFRLFQPSGMASGTGPTVLGVVADTAGGVWARLRGPALVRYKEGAFENIRLDDGSPGSVITAFDRANDGALLLAPLGSGAVEYRDGRVVTIAAPSVVSRSFVIAIADTPDGDVWLGTRDAGLLRVRVHEATPISKGLPDQKVNCLLAGENGELWIGTDRGVARWTGGEVQTKAAPGLPEGLPALAMVRDRDANVWIAAGARGVVRVDRHGAVATAPWDARERGNATAVFEDRDGNIWLGTSRGIERLRDSVFTTFTDAQGLPPDAVGPVFVDDEQRLWFAPAEGGLYWLHQGRVRSVTQAGLDDDIVYSIAGAGDDVWVGRQRGGLTRLRVQGETVTAEAFTQADGLAQNNVYAVLRARDGSVWAGTLSGGVSRWHAGRFATYTATGTDAAASGLASNTVASIVETADGMLWFGTPNGVSTLSPGGWGRRTTRDGLPSNDISTLHEDVAGRVWVGTARGLALIERGAVRPLTNLPTALRAAVLGLAEDSHGGLWIATADGVLRANAARLAGGTARAGLDVREFDIADGLMSADGVKRHRSVIADARGRIWFSTGRGVAVANPDRAVVSALPALPHIEDLTADATGIDLRGRREIPSGHQRITVSFAGLSLSIPERVRYRYRLDGFDRDWSEPVPTREAVYTNLPPGPYRFRVMASNSDGEWTDDEASVRFTIAPAYWQTTWFRVSLAIFAVLAGVAIYRVRMRQVARQLTVRFEERLVERTRIAQELHDTLLQGFISASMQLHVAAERVPDDSPAKASLGHVLRLMGHVIEEGRNAVRGLRGAAISGDDLEHAFSRLPREMVAASDVAFRVIVEGQPRPLHPVIRDEIYRIGREALLNAFRHAGATSIEVELDYAASYVRLLVRDNGCGIDEHVLHAGREGHWGLSGMRERAERIGARFKVWSRVEAGTEVELTVPYVVALPQAATTGRRGWLMRRGRRAAGAVTAAELGRHR